MTHREITPSELVDTARAAFADGWTLFLVAGEDRPAHSAIYAHYLFGRAVSHELLHVQVAVDPTDSTVPSLAGLSFPATRFEREMRDMLGIAPTGHPDPRPMVHHGFWPAGFHPLRADAVVPEFADDGRPFPFTEVQGDGIYEIPVGPVHAGVIEPGHFRFSVLGETILKMRARLYFTHKGTEKLFAGRLPENGVELAERVSGDTSVGHAVAFCEALEAAAHTTIPPRAQQLRLTLLELERLYNHITDVGAILADTGFPVGQAHCLRVRETVLRCNKQLTGHRLLRGVVIPGGVRPVSGPGDALAAALESVVRDFNDVVEISLDNTMVRDRLEQTGTPSVEVARDFGVVGYVARACGLGEDIRRDFASSAYQAVRMPVITETAGDVQARMLVRVREAAAAVDAIGRALTLQTGPELSVPLGPIPPYEAGFGLTEGWRGRIAHMIMTDESGRLHRVKIVDPSFFNWPALARALTDNIVPDFPLCNKSFNQSYSGNDL